MALELLVNAVLAVFFGYCIINVQTSVPASNPGEMGSAVWPTIILGLLVFFLIVNMVSIWKKTPADKRNMSAITDIKIMNILRSKLFWGILVLGAYSMCLDYVGFLVGSFVFCIIFSFLLGQKNPAKLALFAFIATVVLYLLFYKGMGIMLPRGTGIFRSLGLAVESLLRNLF
jgi:hypothetical protein